MRRCEDRSRTCPRDHRSTRCPPLAPFPPTSGRAVEAGPRHRRWRARPAERGGGGDRDVPSRRCFRLLGEAGLLGLRDPEEYGGGGQPYEVYLQVLEEIGAVWASVGVGRRCTRCRASAWPRPAPRSRSRPGCPTCSAASCSAPTASPSRTPAPTPRRCARRAGATATTTCSTARRPGPPTAGTPTSTRSWPAPATAATGSRASWCPADAAGLSADPPEQKMGLTGSTTPPCASTASGSPSSGVRRGGRRAQDRARGPRLRTARHRRRGDRARPGSARRGGRLRGGARDLRQADHRPPGTRLRARRHGGRGPERPGDHLAAARLKDRGLPFGREAASPSSSPPTTP